MGTLTTRARPLTLGALAAIAAMLVAAPAQAATFVGTPTTTAPSYYVPKNVKARCRARYAKRTVTLRHRRHGKLVKVRQVRCVLVKSGNSRSGGSGSSSGGASTFPANLPVVAVTVSLGTVASDHTYATVANQVLSVGGSGVLAGASGSDLSALLVSGPSHGKLALNRNGSFTYTPAPGGSGVEHFTYALRTAWGAVSAPGTVTVDVSPIATGGVYSTASGSTLSLPAGTLLSGDVGSGLSASVVGEPASGSLALAADGGFSYTPNAGFAGSDTFSYRVVDSGSLQSAPATVTINVGALPPTVVPQTFLGAVANTTLQVGGSAANVPEAFLGGQSALSGDVDPGGGTLSVTPATIPTVDGGSVTITASGSFTYQPPAGFGGPSDSFTYQVDASEGTSATATATIQFASGRVWYVNNSAAAGGTGTSVSPFNSLGALSGHASSGDVIFLFNGGGPYAGGFAMQSGQALVGQGANLVAGGETLFNAASSGPTLTGAVTLADGAKVTGLAIQGTVSATGVNGFTIDPSVSIAGGGGDALDVTGGSGTDTVGATLTSGGGHSVSIVNRNAGSVSVTGTITDTGTGILVNNDTGAQVAFSGQITSITGSSPAFTATGGGSVTASSALSTLTTSSGLALDVVGPTTIGGPGLTFQSISAGIGGTPVEGVLISGTGTGGGGLTVSGGTIQNATGAAAVSIAGSGPVSLQNMTIVGSAHDGVDVSNVPAFTISNNLLTGTHATAISVSAVGAPTADGFVQNNTIGISGTPGSGSSTGDGIDVADSASANSLLALVGNNSVYGIATGVGISTQAAGGASLSLTFAGNTVTMDSSGLNAATVTQASGGTGTVCLNTVPPPGGSPNGLVAAGGHGLQVAEAAGGVSFQIDGGWTGSPSLATYLTGTLTLASTPAFVVPGGTFVPGTCQVPNQITT